MIAAEECALAEEVYSWGYFEGWDGWDTRVSAPPEYDLLNGYESVDDLMLATSMHDGIRKVYTYPDEPRMDLRTFSERQREMLWSSYQKAHQTALEKASEGDGPTVNPALGSVVLYGGDHGTVELRDKHLNGGGWQEDLDLIYESENDGIVDGELDVCVHLRSQAQPNNPLAVGQGWQGWGAPYTEKENKTARLYDTLKYTGN